MFLKRALYTYPKEPYIPSKELYIYTEKEPYIPTETSLVSRTVLLIDIFLKRALHTYPKELFISWKELYIYTAKDRKEPYIHFQRIPMYIFKAALYSYWKESIISPARALFSG